MKRFSRNKLNRNTLSLNTFSHSTKLSNTLLVKPVVVAMGLLCANSGYAEGAAVNLLLEEVVVTATKKNAGAVAQQTAIAMTAFSGEQLDRMQMRDIEDLSFSMPNVGLDSIGTAKGVANFSIRGYGSNSSIVSIEPTVGLVVNGVYQGSAVGTVLDTFDLASIEVLRGPQGTLFGRNVSGGAVLVNTRTPGETFSANFKTSIETGMDRIVAGGVDFPLVDEVLLARVSGYYNRDDGWFKNEFDGKDIGKEETYVFRPTVTWRPTDSLEIISRYEVGKTDTHGARSQGRGGSANFDEDSFKVAIDEPGYVNIEWSSVTIETNIDVEFGDGVITNIFGWREVEQGSLVDVDSFTSAALHSRNATDTEQFSNEFRYSGSLSDSWEIVAGVYWFQQDLRLVEDDSFLGGALTTAQGGNQEQSSYALFVNNDFSITPKLTLIAGLRYTYEEKEAEAVFPMIGNCFVLERRCNAYTFPAEGDQGSEDWSSVSPKLGFQYFPSEEMQVYATLSRGFRSGGYNLRLGSETESPGPFDKETLTALEFGVKSEWFDNRLRANLAVFNNEIKDLQRAVVANDPSGVPRQTVTNTADATISGAEMDLIAVVTDQLVVTASVGYVDGTYDKVKFDISGDGLVNDIDKSLDLTRLAPLTSSVTINYDQVFANDASLSWNLSYNHRDSAAFSDSNSGFLARSDIFNAGVAFTSPSGEWIVSLYGKNLTDEVTYGLSVPLPDTIIGLPTGGNFSPLNEGRRVGLELSYSY
jgi:iron complex outermembrane recepter protein